MSNKDFTKEEVIHYLKVLLENGVIFQPEIRFSLKCAIDELQGSLE